ncbi:hypothetical protein J1614_009672 [Plenodomus biglobosus]|nr:hypothetical protein J1614_009672 [Plenodomus biglobosus]
MQCPQKVLQCVETTPSPTTVCSNRPSAQQTAASKRSCFGSKDFLKRWKLQAAATSTRSQFWSDRLLRNFGLKPNIDFASAAGARFYHFWYSQPGVVVDT